MMGGRIQIDVWAGDLHERHAGSYFFDDWPAAQRFIRDKVETGFSCHVLNTDFRCPDGRVTEEACALVRAWFGGRDAA